MVYVRLSCVMTGCFYSLSSPSWGAVYGYLVVNWLRGVHWTRWAFNLQLCPRLCEQVRRLPRTKGGLDVSGEKGGREVSFPGRELVLWRYRMVKWDEPGILGFTRARPHPFRQHLSFPAVEGAGSHSSGPHAGQSYRV